MGILNILFEIIQFIKEIIFNHYIIIEKISENFPNLISFDLSHN